MRNWTYGIFISIGLLALPNTAPAQTQVDEPATTNIGRIRSRHQGLRAMITTASEQSATFRRMVETINTSDGFVYIEPGRCRHGVRACLVTVSSVGRYRFLFVKVDIVRADHEVMASVGHELRHAVEILGEAGVRNTRTMYFFYKYNGQSGGFSANSFETNAAIDAGDAVANEIGRFRRRK